MALQVLCSEWAVGMSTIPRDAFFDRWRFCLFANWEGTFQYPLQGNFQIWDVLGPQSGLSSCQCTPHAGREALGLRDSRSDKDYLHTPSLGAELHPGVPRALPGWREPRRWWGKVALEELDKWPCQKPADGQSWAGEEQVRLGGKESCLLFVPACLNHFCGIFWFQIVFLNHKAPCVKLYDERGCAVLTQQ